MKNQIFTFLLTGISILFIGCSKDNRMEKVPSGGGSEVSVIEVDSCEYILYQGYSQGGIVHKQNCKYCKNRK